MSLMDIILDDAGKFADIRVRLMGTNLSEFYGEMTNGALAAIPFAKSRDRLETAIVEMIKVAKPLTLCAHEENQAGSMCAIKALLIPFASDCEKIDMVFLFFEIDVQNNKSMAG